MIVLRRVTRVIRFLPAPFVIVFLLAMSGCETPPAANTPVPPTLIGDAPAVALHTSQAEIEDGTLSIDEILQRGERLFVASFNTLDGAGRPGTMGNTTPRDLRVSPENFNRISGPDSNSCAGCHNLPRPGGGGDNVANVFVLAQNRPFVEFDGGEGDNFQQFTLQSVGNERNTLGMFGAGYVELLAREMTADLLRIKQAAFVEARRTGNPVSADLVTKGVTFGRITAQPSGIVDTAEVEGIDKDLIVKPFHQKGTVISLRQFTVNAMNHHHGMQATERYGDGSDADQDGVVDELTRGDVTAITLFQAMLPIPAFVIPEHPEARLAAERGQALFGETGCAMCHMPTLPLYDSVFVEPGPYNPPGNYRESVGAQPYAVDLTESGVGPDLRRDADGVLWVPVFTDLKRHDMGSVLNNETLEQNHVPTEDWLTRKLWGFASEPSYLHHGRATLISEAILAHGGEAQGSRDAFAALSAADQAAVVEFLKCLQVIPEGADPTTFSAHAVFDR
jgi:hypothetical protein